MDYAGSYVRAGCPRAVARLADHRAQRGVLVFCAVGSKDGAMTSSIALYYPWIHFRDDDWLKVAMLYWSRVQRIVPEGYDKQDSRTVSAFADAGYILDGSPVTSRRRIAAEFEAAVEQHEVPLRQAYAVDPSTLWTRSNRITWHTVPTVDGGSPQPLSYIHVDKVEWGLTQRLLNSGLGVLGRDGDPAWLGVHSELARIYMTALAHDIAAGGNFQPLSDDAVDCLAVGGWSVDRLTEMLVPSAADPPPDPGPAQTLAFYAIRSVVPTNLPTLTPERILAVRKEYGDELNDFRAAITSLVDEAGLGDVHDADALSTQVQVLYEERLAGRVEQLRKDLRRFDIPTTASWVGLSTTLGGVGTVAANTIGVTDPTVTGAGAVLLGAVALHTNAKAKARSKLANNPAAYLLRLQEGLEPSALQAQLQRGIRKVSRVA